MMSSKWMQRVVVKHVNIYRGIISTMIQAQASLTFNNNNNKHQIIITYCLSWLDALGKMYKIEEGRSEG